MKKIEPSKDTESNIGQRDKKIGKFWTFLRPNLLKILKNGAEKAQLKNVISNLSDGYETIVGERGVRLSGGQQQRIAIARALYKNADVLVFDEATSALDNQTEDSVMQAIEGLGREITVIMIAHRLTTLKKCTKIIKLAEGKVDKIGRYEDIIKKIN